MTHVETEEVEPGLHMITISNGKLNPLCAALLDELAQACRTLSSAEPKVVVITGGENHFAAGADITEFTEGGQAGGNTPSQQNAGRVGTAFFEALNAVDALPCPTIAAINGVALGGGCELALACDFRVAAEKSVLGQPEILLGIIPGGGGTQRLARLVGVAKAKDLVFSGRNVGVGEALEMGLIDRIATTDSRDAAVEWAQVFQNGPREATRLAKRAINEGLSMTLIEGLELEQRLFVESFGTDDAAVGVDSFLTNGPGKAVFD
jgi:enoyl-CoA hydratase